jgi:hypothetical protein
MAGATYAALFGHQTLKKEIDINFENIEFAINTKLYTLLTLVGCLYHI